MLNRPLEYQMDNKIQKAKKERQAEAKTLIKKLLTEKNMKEGPGVLTEAEKAKKKKIRERLLKRKKKRAKKALEGKTIEEIGPGVLTHKELEERRK